MHNHSMEAIAYVYTRVSTESQNITNNNNSSLDTQHNICNNFANTNNMILHGVYSEVCSGRLSENQKELLKLFNRMKRYHSTRVYLLVSDVTRFSRDITGIGKMFENCSLKDYDIVVHSVNDNVSYTTADKKNHNNTNFMNKLLDSQKEWDKISQRAKQAYQARKDSGNIITRIPYGKMRSISGYKKNESEMKVIKSILNLKNQGYTLKNIINYLQDNNVTKRGKPFTVSMINAIMKNNNKMSMKSMKTALNSL